jgi:PAS domain-containing protein
MGLAERFMIVYSNLPLNIRKEIILVINDEPITWNVAYREIGGKTKTGEEILKKLEELKII